MSLWSPRIEHQAAVMRSRYHARAFPEEVSSQVREIVKESAKIHGVTVGDVRARRKTSAAACEARRDAALQLRSLGLSYPEIGVALNRHHTSVMYYFERQPREVPTPRLKTHCGMTMKQRVEALEHVVLDLQERLKAATA